MRTRVKVILCLLLMAFAAVSLAAVLTELGVLPRTAPAGEKHVFPLAFSCRRL